MTIPMDHFSGVADTYVSHRPRYPEALFDWLAEVAPGRSLAWEPGAGSGQASIGLAGRFDHVVATDLSEEMIGRAPAHPRVAYSVGVAEGSGLPNQSVDIVAVAQALHWFDQDRFHAEVRRVLVPGGVVAAWSYGILNVQGPEVHRAFREFYDQVLAPWWPAERRHVEEGYRTLSFPFETLISPAFQMTVRWPLPTLLGYCRSWSAVARYRRARNEDPIVSLEARLAPVWGDPAARRIISWPLAVRAGRVPPVDPGPG
jgi:SAM-dependent methyltransferase